MTTRPMTYLMENLEEAVRLEVKTDPEMVRKQARWCGLKPGLRVLDAGCGPGKVTSILHQMIRPGGEVLGVDYSRERIQHAETHYGHEAGIDFLFRDLRDPMDGLGLFDVIWVRFVLEYNREECPEIVKNLTSCLKPDGHLCLLDLDHNCLNHYGMPAKMEQILLKIVAGVEEAYNFDPFAGRKLYAFLYDQKYRDIRLELTAHHLIYGNIRDEDFFNWIKKAEVLTKKAPDLFKDYPGKHDAFFPDFRTFFLDPRRFTYTPLILCKGMKPLA